MNILILVNGLPPTTIGGTETQTFEIAKRLSEKNNVFVVTRGFKDTPREERLHGFLVKRSPYVRLGVPLGIYTLTALYELFKSREKIDAILGMGVYSGFIGVLAKKLWGIPVVVSVRSETDCRGRSGLRGLIGGFVVGNSNAIWVQSELTRKEFLRNYPNNKTYVIPNGLEINGRRAKGKKIIYVGSLYETDTKDKGVKYLVEAMRHLKGYELLIVGDGLERRKLESLAEGVNVEFTGNIPPTKVKDHLLEAGVFAFPAVYGEGLPNAVLEALSVGLPVVATKTSKLDGIIRDGETGFLVDPRDPMQLADKIRLLFEDENLRRKMSGNCVREAEKFSWEKTIPKIEELLKKVGR
ncbi:MAG: glycosyltransferase family 4 protein [Candidatus Altiarchaeota archaeon]